jgi:outer membrane protein OmpA-like peptidoglycan-associated protein
MKKYLVLLIAIAFCLPSCATIQDKDKAAIGTVAGAAVGAGAGYLVGGGKGALIGGAAGAVVGGGIGYYLDRQEKKLRDELEESEAASIRREEREAEEDEKAGEAGEDPGTKEEPAKDKVDVLIVSFKSDYLFDSGSAVLKPDGQSEIDRVSAILNEYPETTLRIEGHTDSVGAELANLTLSKKRAEAVKDALVAKEIAPARIETVGLGESSLVASDDTEEGRKQNRRVEIVIIPVEEEVKDTQQTEE